MLTRANTRQLLWVVALFVCSVLWPSRVDARPDPDSIEALRKKVAAVLKREGVPGVGIAIIDRDGIVWSGGVGVADLETGRPVTADTLFRLASITKSFIALGVARLADQGKLDLDAPLSEVIPRVEITNRWEDESPITVAHVLEHTAGFDDMRFNERFGRKSAERRPLLEVLALNPRSRVARWRPGTRHSYSNPGYTVAAATIEAVTGERYQDYVRREVFGPIGISDARFYYDEAARERLARGYAARGVAAPYAPLHHHPAGSLITSPRELAKLVHHFVARSDAIVSPRMLARMERAGTLHYPATDMVYGLGVYGDVLHPTVCRGHNGGLPGYSTNYRYCPELGAGYVMLLNASHSPRAHVAIRQLLFEFIAQGRVVRPPAPEKPPRADLEAYTGYYEYLSPRFQLVGFLEKLDRGVTIELQDEHLMLTLSNGRSLRMLATGSDSFRFPGQGGSVVRFTKSREGRDVLVLGGAYFERRSGFVARWRLRIFGWARWILWSGFISFFANLLAWRLKKWVGPIASAEGVALLAGPALAAFCIYGAIALFVGTNWIELGERNAGTIGVCVLTVVFAVVSGLSLVAPIAALARRRFEGGISTGSVRVQALLGGIACSGLALWLALNDIIGLRTWAW